MFRQQREKFFSDICCNIFAQKWVESNNISLSLFLVIIATMWEGLQGFVHDGMFEATSLYSLIVLRGSFFECCFVSG